MQVISTPAPVKKMERKRQVREEKVCQKGGQRGASECWHSSRVRRQEIQLARARGSSQPQEELGVYY